MLYTCVCGRTYTNPQSFNGHKSRCKIHHRNTYGNLDYLEDILKNIGIKSGTALHNKHEGQKNITLSQWVSEQHKCEKCGKVMTEKFGSGRFCSRSCANSRTWTPEINEKRKQTLLKNPNIQKQRILRTIKKDEKRTKFIIEKSTVRIDPLLLDIYGSFISKHNHTVLNQFKLINHIDSNVDILSIPNIKKQFYDFFSFVRFCNYDIYWLDIRDEKLVCNIVTFDNLKDFYTPEVKPIPEFSSYYASTWGGVYKYNLVDIGNAESDGYYLPRLINDLGETMYIAKHRLIAKTFLSTYREDLVVHHIDGNKHNNSVDNLLPMTSSEHSKLHANPTRLASYIQSHGPYNKGMKMSADYCEKCKQSALKRWGKK